MQAGFDDESSKAALRMANYNVEQAFEILLTNQPGLIEFMAKEKQKKQEDEKRKNSNDKNHSYTLWFEKYC